MTDQTSPLKKTRLEKVMALSPEAFETYVNATIENLPGEHLPPSPSPVKKTNGTTETPPKMINLVKLVEQCRPLCPTYISFFPDSDGTITRQESGPHLIKQTDLDTDGKIICHIQVPAKLLDTYEVDSNSDSD